MRNLSRHVAGVALAAMMSLPVAPASALELYVFGDSLSDTDNIFGLTGGVLPPGPTSPVPGPYFEGRSSNGEIWVDSVAFALGLTVSNVWTGGVASGPGAIHNFALAGAFTGTLGGFANVNDLSPLNVFYPPGAIPLLGLQQQVDEYAAAAAGVSADAQHVIWAGPNDLFFAPAFGISPDNASLIAVAVGNIRAAIEDLAATGASEFLVLNLPDLGATPLARSLGPPFESAFSAGSDLFNDSLTMMLGDVSAALGVEIMELDIHALFDDLLADPPARGFPGAGVSPLPPGIGPCFDQDTATLLCNLATEDPNDNIFWDVVHPSSRTHGLIADAVLAATVSEPASFVLVLIGVGGVAFAARASKTHPMITG